MEAMTGRRIPRAALAALAAALILAAAIPAGAGAAAVPWGEGCRPAIQGEPRTSATCGAELIDGRAVPPPGAPPAVKAAIAAANHIAGRPYIWGGGHLGFDSRGYDCSGAVSYALHGAGLLGTPLVSGQLAYWGSRGSGRWISVYANSHHVFIVIAGLRFDTRDSPPGVTGPRWHTYQVDQRNFTARHPAGL
jgi:cell wall-associated NlpC family hydrolase